ncbi:FAD-dependent oxidoreductase [Hydrogenophaga laconesensis]|uniref:3-(3-hydroxy-phenyl)propionate hydroxylase n=1 Tax=Hydrogenophaga laconesensis TaxID=1805971 RepID=A0ABU1VC36_9BURK|nr:FAD-dependent oxidoreductase [Hydrogenophaga laconesensis]MDR7095029.1 3-(3-hydroxy-phenyl)propionate hydroxylase [Hydrogenophaga laconesensis]
MSATAYRDTALTNNYEFTSGAGYVLPEYDFVPPPELQGGPLVRHPIVIVGGGITGLTMACSLARLGVRAVLLDEDNTVGVKGASSRGICYTQKSLEIFERLGIFERIAAKGTQWSVGRTFAGDDEVYSFDLRQQGNFHLSSQPPFINIQQFYIEAFLVDRIQQLGGVELRWQNRLTAFEQNAECATLTVETPAGTYRMEAEHVIDATGSVSPLRKWLAVPFDSRRGDDRWCIADVRFTEHPPVERHTWIEAPFNENRAVWQHLMADDVWRIDYQMAPNADPAYVSREDVVRERLARQFGSDVGVEIVWVGPYAYRSECVHAMRHGRVFLMGDSAKVVSPFGARGGNTGVADADNLAWKLAAVLRGKADVALLQSYHDERLEAAQQNVCVTNRTARFLRPADGAERVFRHAAIGLAKQYPFARSLINTGRMAVANPYSRSGACTYAAGSAAGQSVQNVSFCWADGSAGRVNDLLNWVEGDLLVLVFGEATPASLQRLRRLCLDAPVRSVQVLGVRDAAQATEHVRDPQGHLQGACQVSGNAWALVRPDGYLAATGDAINARLVTAIERSLGLRGDTP